MILIDRGIEPDDPSLYVTRIAPDNVEVSKGVAEWAVTALPDGGNYFVLEGPAGVGVVNERNDGWDSVMDDQPQFVKVGAQTANWSAEEGKSVMETVLKANDNDIQLVFAQNDEMGLGAALAVEEAGLVPGEDVLIATIDGTKGAHGGAGRRPTQLRRRVQPAVRRHRRRRGDARRSLASPSSRTSSCRAERSTRRKPPRRRCPPASTDLCPKSRPPWTRVGPLRWAHSRLWRVRSCPPRPSTKEVSA